VRLSGPSAQAIALSLIGRERPLEPRRATTARFTSIERSGAPPIVDRVVVTFFKAPHSYTTQDVVEIGAHGSPVVLRAIIETAIAAGARLARPGEFTFRAYLGGRIDLTQAEAVADLVGAVTSLQARAASEQLEGGLAVAIRAAHEQLFDLIARLEASLDFPDEGYHFVEPGEAASAIRSMVERLSALTRAGSRGRLIREGVTVAIIGRPNAGKSSLFNRLVGSNRAIVTSRPGTTRDVLTEIIDLHGVRVTLVDTAGLREASDEVEAEGVRRAEQAAAAAQVTVIVLDLSAPLDREDRELLSARRASDLVVGNKCDVTAAWSIASVPDAIAISATTGEAVDRLAAMIVESLGLGTTVEVPLVTNVRHVALIERAVEALERAAPAATPPDPLPEEFVLADLHDARTSLEEVVGLHSTDDLLTHIFSRFCIGK
jgi:tRNA modification GTPase